MYTRILPKQWDLIVIGSGIIGSWTALQAMKSSKDVLLIDQFSRINTRNSSHGKSRIIRHSYIEPFYAQMMPLAYSHWKNLESITGVKLMKDIPLLSLGTDEVLESILINLYDLFGQSSNKFCKLSPKQIKEQFPEANFSTKHNGIIEYCAGVLNADKCLQLTQEQFIKNGGIIKENEKIISIRSSSNNDNVAIINSNREIIKANKVAVCCGPWTPHLINPLLDEPLPVKALRVIVWFWKIIGPHLKVTFKDMTTDFEYYGIPEFDYNGLAKVAHPWPRQFVNPDNNHYKITEIDKKGERQVAEYIKKTLPGLCFNESAVTYPCYYTMSDDEICIIDNVPDSNNIVFATGFSGSGFKKAPVIGSMILELLQITRTAQLDMTPFKLDRFKQKEKK